MKLPPLGHTPARPDDYPTTRPTMDEIRASVQRAKGMERYDSVRAVVDRLDELLRDYKGRLEDLPVVQAVAAITLVAMLRSYDRYVEEQTKLEDLN